MTTMTREPSSDRLARRARDAHIACVVPMFNEGEQAGRFLDALNAFLAPRCRLLTLLVVDDGSRDRTAAEVQAAIGRGLPVHFVRLSRNFGKERALTAGLATTDRLAVPADVVLLIDADFQHPFEAVEAMIARWEEGVDMVYGVQVRRADSGPLRRAFTWLFYRVLRASNERIVIPPDAGDFRLLDRRVVAAINRLPERSRYMKGLYAWVGFTSEGVRFESRPRTAGTSTFTLGRLGDLAFDGLTSFTSWPLRVSSVVGAVISFGAFLYGCWLVFERLVIGQEIAGFTTVAAAIMFFSGIQLMSIGLLGEYLGRVYIEVKGRPLYLIAEERAATPALDPMPSPVARS